jgi:predicted kinase
VLIIMAGLPATGKTTLARAVARRIGGLHVRVDTIEQAVIRSGAAEPPIGSVGYLVGYAIAEDNLRLGATVLADSVNPLAVTRRAWREVAGRCDTPYLEVEVVCGDPAEHRHRAESRGSDIADLRVPTWTEIGAREYDGWDNDRVVVDTAGRTVDDCVAEVLHALGRRH